MLSDYYYTIFGSYLFENGFTKPDLIMDWLEKTRDKRLLELAAMMMASSAPERIAALMVEEMGVGEPGTNNNRGTAVFGSIFSQLGSRDPMRAGAILRDLEHAEFQRQGVRNLLLHLDYENFPFENWEKLFALIGEETLQDHKAVAENLAHPLNAYPPATALANFPLEGDSWRRVVAVRYLQLHAETHFYAQEIRDYLASPAAAPLRENERAKILSIIEKTQEKAAKAMAR